jgi:DNA-binding HxlR family transcriptional regulator
MAASRRYGDLCPTAGALDAIGERWALLVVRESLFGAQRFSDLRRALPGASSNMLTDRLRELEAREVVCRGTSPPLAASRVYEIILSGWSSRSSTSMVHAAEITSHRGSGDLTGRTPEGSLRNMSHREICSSPQGGLTPFGNLDIAACP